MRLADLRGVAARPQEREEIHKGVHPTLADYVRVAGALAVVTSLEVAIYYLEPLRGVLVELFLALSSIKFMLVVMWYMHLRFDSPIFSFLFAFGVAVAIAVFIATLATMGAGLL